MELTDTITDAYGNQVSVGSILMWISYHADLTVDQLAGANARTGIPAAVPGWPQLGGRTVVDALAAIGEKLGIAGFDSGNRDGGGDGHDGGWHHGGDHGDGRVGDE
jgi:hypothetical protein